MRPLFDKLNSMTNLKQECLSNSLSYFVDYPCFSEGARATNYIRLYLLPSYIKHISGDDTRRAMQTYDELVREIIKSSDSICIGEMLLQMMEGERSLPPLFLERPDYLLKWSEWLAWGDPRFYAIVPEEYKAALDQQEKYRIKCLERSWEKVG